MRNYSELWILMGFNEIYILGGGGGEFLGNRYTILCLGNNYYDLVFFFIIVVIISLYFGRLILSYFCNIGYFI